MPTFLNIKSILKFSSILLAFTSFQVLAQDQPETVIPQMHIEDQVFHFGEVNRGEKVSHDFVVKNVGKSNLLIEDIRPDCGCTIAVTNDKTVVPGSETVVKVGFDTIGFSGSKTRVIRLFTNDPKQPVAFLRLEGTVMAPVIADPPRLYFGNIESGKKDSKKFKLRLGEKVKIENVSSDNEALTVAVSEGSKSKGNEIEYTATLGESIAAGPFRATIKVKTTDSRDSYINIPVFAGVKGEISSLPSEVSFGLLPGPLTEEVVKEIKVTAGHQIEFAEIEALSENGRVEAKVVSIDPDGKTAYLRVSLLGGAFGSIRTKVNLRCLSKDGKELAFSIPVYAIVATRGD